MSSFNYLCCLLSFVLCLNFSPICFVFYFSHFNIRTAANRFLLPSAVRISIYFFIIHFIFISQQSLQFLLPSFAKFKKNLEEALIGICSGNHLCRIHKNTGANFYYKRGLSLQSVLTAHPPHCRSNLRESHLQGFVHIVRVLHRFPKNHKAVKSQATSFTYKI